MNKQQRTPQKFATPAPITAVLDIPAGHIRLIAADRTDATVEILPANPAKSRDVTAAEQASVSYTDGVLRIDAPAAKNQYFGPSGSIEVTIQLPAGSRVEAQASCAEFRAVGRLGDIAFDGAHGPVKIDEAASVRLTASASDITIGRLNGPAEITTDKGDITITEANSGTVVLSAQMGDLTIGAARGIPATLNAGTNHGRINNTLKNTNTNTNTTNLNIHATTTHGNITAHSH